MKAYSEAKQALSDVQNCGGMSLHTNSTMEAENVILLQCRLTELLNSIPALSSSNDQIMEALETENLRGDADLIKAVGENRDVIRRQKGEAERIAAEMRRRGMGVSIPGVIRLMGEEEGTLPQFSGNLEEEEAKEEGIIVDREEPRQKKLNRNEDEDGEGIFL